MTAGCGAGPGGCSNISLGPVPSRGRLPLLRQLPQPSLEGVEAALDVAELGQELERILRADGVAGAGAA